MKLILRADDTGFSEVGNIGTFEAIDNGVITHADVMLDCPGTEDALRRLKERPWISVGWHAHHWGFPVLDPKEVPSLLDEEGRFKWSVTDAEYFGGWKKPRTREELAELKNSIDYDEAVREFRAEIMRCIDILGRAPDTFGTMLPANPTKVDLAKNQVAKEFGMKMGWFTKGSGGDAGQGFHPKGETPCLPEYADLDIFMPFQGNGTNLHMDDAPAPGEREPYNPMNGFITDGDKIRSHKCAQLAFHPAYVDDFMTYCGGYTYIISRIRIIDKHVMCSQELHDWLRDEKIMLVNQRDAIFGTQEYQNHLKAIDSDLFML